MYLVEILFKFLVAAGKDLRRLPYARQMNLLVRYAIEESGVRNQFVCKSFNADIAVELDSSVAVLLQNDIKKRRILGKGMSFKHRKGGVSDLILACHPRKNLTIRKQIARRQIDLHPGRILLLTY